MRVLMVGVDEKTKGGMWSVARGYLQSDIYQKSVELSYVPLATVGSLLKKMLFFAAGLARILTLLIVKKPDIVHIHMSERASVYRKLLTVRCVKLFSCKVILHLHGAEFESWYSGLSTNRQNFVQHGLNSVDCVVILGEYWKPFISSLMDDKQKIKVLYNAVPVPETNQYRITAKDCLFLGEVGERKGVYDLLDALKLIDDQLDTDYQLLVYGTNPDGDIEKRIEKQKLQHRVRYMGWADPTKFGQLFSKVCVNILPSYHEGLPMTILETMAYGIPNISTNIAAIPEAVNQENGILIRPGDTQSLADALVSLLRNQNLRAQKSEKAYRTVKVAFSTERHMREVLQLYEEII